MSKLNILNLATTDEGGAGIATQFINDLLNKEGHNSVLLVRRSQLRNANVITIQNYSEKTSFRVLLFKIYNRIDSLLKRIKIGLLDPKYCFFNIDEQTQYVSAEKILDKTPFKPDIIILHWVSDFINSESIRELRSITNAKIFWIMLDNAPLTGGCHYPWNCEGFSNDCSDCPAIINPSRKHFSKRNLTLKRKYLPENLELVVCSENDLHRAKKATIFKQNTIHKLLMPVDEKKFSNNNSNESRSFFEIAQDKKVIFYGSISLSDKRKGTQNFMEALSFLQKNLEREEVALDRYLILIAGNSDHELFQNFPIPVKYVGYLSEDNLIKAYQASDLFVCTSLEDSGPLMINQSIMCGTPVVAFETGVVLDLVHTGQTGYRAKHGDSQDLGKGIEYVLSLGEKEYTRMRDNCREVGEKFCSPQIQIIQLIEWFNTKS